MAVKGSFWMSFFRAIMAACKRWKGALLVVFFGKYSFVVFVVCRIFVWYLLSLWELALIEVSVCGYCMNV